MWCKKVKSNDLNNEMVIDIFRLQTQLASVSNNYFCNNSWKGALDTELIEQGASNTP